MSGNKLRLVAVAAAGVAFTMASGANAAEAPADHWAVPYGLVNAMLSSPAGLGYNEEACTDCHGAEKKEGGVDLSTCEGVKAVSAGDMKRNLRDNRMPYGVAPTTPDNLPAIERVKSWIMAGGKDDAAVKQILKDFQDPKAFGGEAACVSCHMSNEEPPSFHEMDLTSYAGIMAGADSKAAPPGVKVVIAGDLKKSKLYQRLAQNRMPPGAEASADNRDTYQINAMVAWYAQGANCH